MLYVTVAVIHTARIQIRITAKKSLEVNGMFFSLCTTYSFNGNELNSVKGVFCNIFEQRY